MRAIYKYPVEYGVTYLQLTGRVLSAGVQGDQIMVWAVHDDDVAERDVRIEVVGTGHPLFKLDLDDFLQTVFLGRLVFHIFVMWGGK